MRLSLRRQACASGWQSFSPRSNLEKIHFSSAVNGMSTVHVLITAAAAL